MNRILIIGFMLTAFYGGLALIALAVWTAPFPVSGCLFGTFAIYAALELYRALRKQGKIT